MNVKIVYNRSVSTRGVISLGGYCNARVNIAITSLSDNQMGSNFVAITPFENDNPQIVF